MTSKICIKYLPINDVRSTLPTARTEEQNPIQNINSTYSNAVIPKKKSIALFSDSIPRGIQMKHLNSQVKQERIHVKEFPGARANQSKSAKSLLRSNVTGTRL